MNASIWNALLVNLALISILVLVWEILSVWLRRVAPRATPLVLGLLFGGGAIASMAMAVPIPPGVIVDLRSSLIATAVYFGGLIGGGISLAAGAAFRLYIGGAGAVAGIVGLIVTASIALTLRRLRHRFGNAFYAAFVVAFAPVLGSICGFASLPADIRTELVPVLLPPTAAVSFVSTLIIALLMLRLERLRRLSSENEAYRQLVRGLPDCLSVKNLQGQFVAANPATARLMRTASPEDLLGKTDADFYPPELAACYAADERAMLELDSELRIEQPITFPDNTTGWLSTLKAPLRDERGRIIGIITYNRDISDQKAIEQLKDEFVSTVSHELRTPLTSIRGSLGLVASGAMGELPSRVSGLVSIATSNCDRLVQLINDVLDLEKLETGKASFDIERCSVRTLLEEAASTGAAYMPDKGARIVLLDDAARAQVDVDAARFQQVMANLMSNAIKFSPPQATVTIRTERLAPGTVRISVEDQGPGIPENFRSRMFGRFEQADLSTTRKKGGTGLGLSIAKSIVEQLGGKIGFECGRSFGTRFYVDLSECQQGNAERRCPNIRARVLTCTSRRDVAERLPALLEEIEMASDAATHLAAAQALMATREYAALILGSDVVHDLGDALPIADVPIVVVACEGDAPDLRPIGEFVSILREPLDGDALLAAIEGTATDERSAVRRILCVENDLSIAHLLREMLEPESLRLVAVRSLAEARQQLRFLPIDLIVLDIALPDGSGLALLSEIAMDLPVVVFTASDLDYHFGPQVKVAMTKTKNDVSDVAEAVANLLAEEEPYQAPQRATA